MDLNLPTIVTCATVITGAIVATPVLIKGFQRRGTGVVYERNFAIQRAPQLLTLANVILIVFSFFFYTGLFPDGLGGLDKVLFVIGEQQSVLGSLLSWLGVLILISGMIFMVGGWYCLGEYFTTDAEILEGQGVRTTGLYQYVMHPIYSGIIQCVVGASLASTSLFCLAFALVVVAPLWLARARYEENNILKHLGPDYKSYGDKMKWRRLVPIILPFGV